MKPSTRSNAATGTVICRLLLFFFIYMIQEEIGASTKKGTIVSPEAIYERLFRIHIFYTVSRMSQNI